MLHSIFLRIIWNTKPQTKQLPERLQQILDNYVRISWMAFWLVCLFFRFSGFFDLFSKVFLIIFKFLNFTIQGDHNSFDDNTSSAKLYFLHGNKKIYWHQLRFIVPVSKIWLGDSSKFICTDQSRFYLFTRGRIKKDWVTLNDRMISSTFSSIATVWFGLEAQISQLINTRWYSGNTLLSHCF